MDPMSIDETSRIRGLWELVEWKQSDSCKREFLRITAGSIESLNFLDDEHGAFLAYTQSEIIAEDSFSVTFSGPGPDSEPDLTIWLREFSPQSCFFYRTDMSPCKIWLGESCNSPQLSDREIDWLQASRKVPEETKRWFKKM